MGTDLTFVVDADNSCSRTIYYRFSVHPGYGTDDYDGLSWTGMTTEEYVTSSTCTYAFDETGQYIVVVWAKDNIADDNTGVKIAGIEVEISEEGQEPYFPFQ